MATDKPPSPFAALRVLPPQAGEECSFLMVSTLYLYSIRSLILDAVNLLPFTGEVARDQRERVDGGGSHEHCS